MLSDYVSYISKMFAGDLAAFGGPSVEEPEAGQIRAEQITLVLGHTPGMMVANACNAAVLAMALWYSPDRNLAVVWTALMIMGAVFFGLKARSSWRISKPQVVSRRAMHNVVRNAFVMGCMWAIVPIAFFADATGPRVNLNSQAYPRARALMARPWSARCYGVARHREGSRQNSIGPARFLSGISGGIPLSLGNVGAEESGAA